MHQWQKFGENPSTDTGDIVDGNMKIWDAFGHAVTLTFDLLTPKSNQFISVPRCTDKSLAKIRQQILEISRKHKTTTWITYAWTDARTDGRTHGRTTRKHTASAGAYRRRRLKKTIHATNHKYVDSWWRRWTQYQDCTVEWIGKTVLLLIKNGPPGL